MSRYNEIYNYTINNNKIGKELMKQFGDSTVTIAYGIMQYAHRNQTREANEPYSVHPIGVRQEYLDFISPFKELEIDKLEAAGIPYYGVSEVCLLHDVLEDTDFTMDELYDIYTEFGYGDYFDKYIRIPLDLVTHKDNVSYDDYLDLVLTNKTASMVKFMDLSNNSRFVTLSSFNEKNFERCKRYIAYAKLINDKYHFIENKMAYYKELEIS